METKSEMIDVCFGLIEEHRKDAVSLYYEAFAQKFSALMTKEEAMEIFPELLNSEQVICALQNGCLVGFAGIQHGKKPLFRICTCRFIKSLGLLRGILTVVVMLLFRRAFRQGELLMDGICVDKNFRGMGIGTLLMEAVFDFAREKGYETIRLDVVDTNPQARKLYERLGFEPVSDRNYPLTKKLMGFSSSTRMVKKITP
ncbi:MAG: GNAT family N-acetyltransferase [Ignavibacteria bacterium]|nr:GNAT family N-acetyltransferase [Ignavibacteria bacterium]